VLISRGPRPPPPVFLPGCTVAPRSPFGMHCVQAGNRSCAPSRSSADGMPSFLTPPSPLDISKCFGNSSTVIPSTPGLPLFYLTRFNPFRDSGAENSFRASLWPLQIRGVNFPAQPLDIRRHPLVVRAFADRRPLALDGFASYPPLPVSMKQVLPVRRLAVSLSLLSVPASRLDNSRLIRFLPSIRAHSSPGREQGIFIHPGITGISCSRK
jgi:hypothetical protein